MYCHMFELWDQTNSILEYVRYAAAHVCMIHELLKYNIILFEEVHLTHTHTRMLYTHTTHIPSIPI